MLGGYNLAAPDRRSWSTPSWPSRRRRPQPYAAGFRRLRPGAGRWPRRQPAAHGGHRVLGRGRVVHPPARACPSGSRRPSTRSTARSTPTTSRPAVHAVTRADIPRHALAMGEKRFPGGLAEIAELRARGQPVAFVGDVVGTGSSRKSATNSLLWHIGEDIPFIPNKRRGGVVLGGAIAPIFFNTLEDSGALPIQCDVSGLKTGQTIVIRPHEGKIAERRRARCWPRFELKPPHPARRIPRRRPRAADHRQTLTDSCPQGPRPGPTATCSSSPAAGAQGGGGLHPGPEDGRPRLRRRRASTPARSARPG